MSSRIRLSSLAWIPFLLLSLGFVAWGASIRAKRVAYVSGLAGWSVADPGAEASLTVKTAPWQPRLVVPEPSSASYEWLNQTRQMFATRELRIRHVDYENAPFGLDVHAASPYRWILGSVALAGRTLSGGPLGAALERGALVTDPFLQGLLGVVAALLVAWRFGGVAGALVAVGLGVLFPFGGEFLAGVPDDHGLALACAVMSVLPVLAGFQAAFAGDIPGARRWLFLGGLVGGLGLWVGVSYQTPFLVGIALGGILAAVFTWGHPDAPRVSWRAWAFGGALASLLAYMLEYAPSHLGSWQLRVIHPLYGLAWLGLGELLTQLTPGIPKDAPRSRLRRVAFLTAGVIALASLPVAMHLTHSQGFLAEDLPMLKLTRLPGVVMATTVSGWFTEDGMNGAEWATMIPVLIGAAAVGLLFLRRAGPGPRAVLAVALGPAAVALGFACFRLGWWSALDAALVPVLAAATWLVGRAFKGRLAPGAWAVFVALVLLPGLLELWPASETGASNALNESEVIGLINRDLARWLVRHSDEASNAILLAPPDASPSFYYYAGLRGLATLGWENREGIGASIRIVSASTPEEAQELISRRGLTHLIIPSWDSYLLSYARVGMGQVEGSFLGQLHAFDLPTWLRPVAYPLPTIGGFEGQSITIFEVVDDQDEPTAASRLAEYFIEMGHVDFATVAGQKLRRFPGNLSALTARAEVENARGNADEFNRAVDAVVPRVSGAADKALAWDRRVSLAIVLAQGKRFELSRAEAKQALSEVDEAKLKSLPPLVLYRFEVLIRAIGLEIPNPALRRLALDLLPPAYSSRLGP